MGTCEAVLQTRPAELGSTTSVWKDIQLDTFSSRQLSTLRVIFEPSMAQPLPALITGTEENSLILWVGLSPSQFEELERTSKATPDQYSERFGLREEAQPALERAHYFMTWGEQPEFEPKETVLMQMEITRAGLMELTNSGVLWKLKPGQYRLYGPLESESRNLTGELLYRLGHGFARPM